MSKLRDTIIEVRRHVHANPELGYKTYQTAAYLKPILESYGYDVRSVMDGAGLVARLNLEKSRTVALRSDLDALPIKEETDYPFRSLNGAMHACGHDGHISMLVGAAKLISEHRSELHANVVLIFQPAEEGPLPGGALKMIETGLLDNVNMFFALHVTNKLRSGQVGIKKNEAFAAPDLWEAEITGRGGHASRPGNAVNPIMPACDIVKKFQALWNQIKKNDPYTVITTTYINSGVSMNIITDKAYLKGTARSFTFDMRKLLESRMTEIVEKTSARHKAEGKFFFHYAYDPVYNDDEPYEIALKAARTVFGSRNAIELTEPEMIGEDFAYYRRIAPTCMTWFGVRGPNDDFVDLHSSHFHLDENALERGAYFHFAIAKSFR